MGSGGAGLPSGGGRQGEEPVGRAGPRWPGTGPQWLLTAASLAWLLGIGVGGIGEFFCHPEFHSGRNCLVPDCVDSVVPRMATGWRGIQTLLSLMGETQFLSGENPQSVGGDIALPWDPNLMEKHRSYTGGVKALKKLFCWQKNDSELGSAGFGSCFRVSEQTTPWAGRAMGGLRADQWFHQQLS